MDRLDELAVFVAIVDAGSLAEAARRLRRSPPAVTRCLAGLEDRLGVRLAERTTRRLAPTDAGRRLAENARRLLTDYSEALRAACGGDGQLRGRLRITAPVQFGQRHVMPLIASFLRAYPDIVIDTLFSDSNVDLIEEEVDVAVRIGPLADSTLVARRVGEVGRYLLASPDYLARRGTPTTASELASHDTIFIAARPLPAEWRLAEGERERIVRLTPRLIVNQVEAGLTAAREGIGITRALFYQAAADLEAGRLVRLLQLAEPPLPFQCTFSYPVPATCPRACVLFLTTSPPDCNRCIILRRVRRNRSPTGRQPKFGFLVGLSAAGGQAGVVSTSCHEAALTLIPTMGSSARATRATA